MTTIEGFACGTPGIVYNCTASPEIITEETGIVVKPGDIKQLIKSIETIRSKGKSFYSSNCRKLAENKYDNKKSYGEYLQLYSNMLKEPY